MADEKCQDGIPAEERPNYWAVIPAHVRYDKDLRPNAKLLYGELAALAGADGYCWATDKYFSELFSLDAATINRLINALARKGYIRIEHGADKKGVQRRIYAGAFLVTPLNGGIDKNVKTPGGSCSKSQEGSCSKSQSHKDNNLNINKNPPLSPQGETAAPCGALDSLSAEMRERLTAYCGDDAELLAAMGDWILSRKRLRKPLTTMRALELNLKQLDRLSGGNAARRLYYVDAAVMRCWLGFYDPDKDGGLSKFDTESATGAVHSPGVERWD